MLTALIYSIALFLCYQDIKLGCDKKVRPIFR